MTKGCSFDPPRLAVALRLESVNSNPRHRSFNWDLGLFKNFQITESKKLQFRINGYNFLNHPLWSFNGSNLNLGFDPSTGKLNTPNFGTVTDKQGRRIVQLAVKFVF